MKFFKVLTLISVLFLSRGLVHAANADQVRIDRKNECYDLLRKGQDFVQQKSPESSTPVIPTQAPINVKLAHQTLLRPGFRYALVEILKRLPTGGTGDFSTTHKDIMKSWATTAIMSRLKTNVVANFLHDYFVHHSDHSGQLPRNHFEFVKSLVNLRWVYSFDGLEKARNPRNYRDSDASNPHFLGEKLDNILVTLNSKNLNSDEKKVERAQTFKI